MAGISVFGPIDGLLHQVYEGAWERAMEYADVQPNEMPKFPEEAVHWMMKANTVKIDHDVTGGWWITDMFSESIGRTYAWYKADFGLKVVDGISVPINARIEMLITQDEIMKNTHEVEGILAHEMIHYIHHMRIMNLKGWITMWPGDGHNYLAYLRFVKGYDVPANR